MRSSVRACCELNNISSTLSGSQEPTMSQAVHVFSKHASAFAFAATVTLVAPLATANTVTTENKPYAIEPVSVSAPRAGVPERLSRIERQALLNAVRGEYELKNGSVANFGGTANRTVIQLDEKPPVLLRVRAPLDYESIDGNVRVRFTEAGNGEITSVKVSMRN
jgi:hypothetical protein